MKEVRFQVRLVCLSVNRVVSWRSFQEAKEEEKNSGSGSWIRIYDSGSGGAGGHFAGEQGVKSGGPTV